MALGKYDSRHHTVLCPIIDCSTRIFMDRGAYAAHMVANHDADADGFPDEGIRGIGQYDRSAVEGGPDAIFREEEILRWCGCGSTPNNVLSHLIDDHGVTLV